MRNRVDARERRFWNKLRCGTSAEKAAATFALSALLCDRDREDEAEEILTECARSRDDSIAAAASIRLARVIERGAGPAAAAANYQRAAELASPTESADVLIDLAERWAGRGEGSRAHLAYEEIVLGNENADLRALAGFRLGAIEHEAGLLVSAIGRWDDALVEAKGPLRTHILVNLAEAVLELPDTEASRAAALLGEAIESDHPDLAPRAAIAFARLQRHRGELIDAYRLAQLAVDSEHPVFAPEGEAERARLIDRELDTLFDLDPPVRDQLELEGDEYRRAIYVPIFNFDAGKWAAHESSGRGEMWSDSFSPMVQGIEEPALDDDDNFGGCALRTVSAMLWKRASAFFGQFEPGAVESALNGDEFPRAIQAALNDSPDLMLTSVSSRAHGPGWRPGDDFRLMVMLRASIWLRNRRMHCGSLTAHELHLVFAHTSAHLSRLLANDEIDHHVLRGICHYEPADLKTTPTVPQELSISAEDVSRDLRAEAWRRRFAPNHISRSMEGDLAVTGTPIAAGLSSKA